VGVVIDTSALVAVERAGTGWERALDDVGDEQAVVPAIVYAELLVGVHLADTAARASNRRRRIDALIMRCPVVEFDRAIAARWAETVRKAQPGRPNDFCQRPRGRGDRFAPGLGVLVGPKDETHYRRIPELRCVRLSP
jgi:predicted nucleic acid-binding protein